MRLASRASTFNSLAISLSMMRSFESRTTAANGYEFPVNSV
jgi:hypothetical protein